MAAIPNTGAEAAPAPKGDFAFAASDGCGGASPRLVPAATPSCSACWPPPLLVDPLVPLAAAKGCCWGCPSVPYAGFAAEVTGPRPPASTATASEAANGRRAGVVPPAMVAAMAAAPAPDSGEGRGERAGVPKTGASAVDIAAFV